MKKPTFGSAFSWRVAWSLPVRPEHVGTSHGQSPCVHCVFDGMAFSAHIACSIHAVGGGRMNNFTAPTSPRRSPVVVAIGVGYRF